MQAYAELLEEGDPKIPAWFFSPKDGLNVGLNSPLLCLFKDCLCSFRRIRESRSPLFRLFFHLKPAKAIVDAIQLEPAKAIENENYALAAGIQDQNSELESGGAR
ncbi:hypothetical protein C5167_036716 [Papaver somniferum]|uniref:Uncharacterized protein n=1 Tax=Papaver somniferum TaxID=3469 RepID=A0A4Y7I4G5_PAPSO|nr:hypothetical protein C5167_036716 [Papaver somniferum]